MSQRLKGPLLPSAWLKPKVHSCLLQQFPCILNRSALGWRERELQGLLGTELMILQVLSEKNPLY